MPRIEATAIVTLPLTLRLTMMVTSAVSAMIEPSRTIRRVQSSTFTIQPPFQIVVVVVAWAELQEAPSSSEV
jgi:hypothetical protein